MTQISKDDVKYVAALAKIAITDDEAEKFTKDLSEILGYVEQLDSVNTDGLQPTYQVNGLINITRDDQIIDYKTSREKLLANAPKTNGEFVEVPKVL